MTEKQKLDKICSIASEWWSEVIKNPKMDNGDDSEGGRLTTMLLHLATSETSEKQRNEFKQGLYNQIRPKVENLETDISTFWLNVDYSPCENLARCAEQCNISLNNFPVKTSIKLTKHCVLVKYGYNSDVEILYADKWFYNYQIEDLELSIKHYENTQDEFFKIADKQKIINSLKNKLKIYKKNIKDVKD